MNFKGLVNVQSNGILKGPNFDQVGFEGDVWVQGKVTRTPSLKNSKSQTDLLDIIYLDSCESTRVESLSRAKYFAAFVDDCSKWCEVYFLKSKNDVFEKFEKLKTKVKNQKQMTAKNSMLAGRNMELSEDSPPFTIRSKMALRQGKLALYLLSRCSLDFFVAFGSRRFQL